MSPLSGGAIVGINHVQLAAPPGSEHTIRRFYGDLLGMVEIDVPQEPAGEPGLWFRCGAQQLHIGIEDDFHPARLAHPALQLVNLTTLGALEAELVLEGIKVEREEGALGFRRFYANDPFGNRLEFVCPSE